MTAVYIILAIAAALFLLSLLRVGVHIAFGDELRVTALAGPVRIQVLPKPDKPKKEKKPLFGGKKEKPEKKEKPAKTKKTTHSTKSVKEKAETDRQSMMAEAAAVFNGKAGETAAAAAERLAGISDKLAEAKAGLSSKIISLSSIARRQTGLEEGLDKKVGKE